ncbi:hypothetical protein [Pedococcus bigeumensis]|uniref:Uncharacterized protein n=1 Tax=Pedococcus bigeumensis TaxID=433644 RepID=A0A502CLJ5_9MICO|nr:hypothetical protein [Pedococcus bigeumensis]TPG12561.1 hypothetical protein EAH86_19850 [Pedococcus bigeumensis]
MTTTQDAIAHAKAQTNAAVAIGESRGWERPADFARLTTLGAAAKAAIRDADPVPVPLPTTAAQVDDWLDQTAAARVHAAARRSAAEELALDADRQVARLGQHIAAEYVPKLVEEFATELKAYAALANAPRTITGHETAKDLTAHATLLRCAADLASTLNARATLALITGEADDFGQDAVWLALAVKPSAGLDAVTQAVATFHQGTPSTVADWDSLAPLGLTLAQHGGARTRIERHAAANFTRGTTTPDGGLVERSYGEVEAGALR